LRAQVDAPLSAGVRVLGYHRIASGDVLGVAPDDFRRQLERILEAGAAPVSLSQALTLLESETPVARPYFAVSLDDGYRDNIELGLPILEELGVPASIFLVSGIVAGREGFHWYRRAQAEAITWDEARSLRGHPLCDFQVHGSRHRRLTALGAAALRDEIVGAKAEIEHELGLPTSLFCYAGGVFGPRERKLVKDAGYRAALTTFPGVNQAGADLFALRRLVVSWSDGVGGFELKLAGGSYDESTLERWVRRRRGRDGATQAPLAPAPGTAAAAPRVRRARGVGKVSA
jgi:peptidoglycan/xylan/chitin deacetylase (PgdA/CDA1 family)